MDGSVWDSIVAICILTAYLVQVSNFKYSLASSFCHQRCSKLPPWFSTFLPAISRVLNCLMQVLGILSWLWFFVRLHVERLYMVLGLLAPVSVGRMGITWGFELLELTICWYHGLTKLSSTSIWVILSISDIWPCLFWKKMCCYKALGCQKVWNSSCQIPSKFHWKNAFSCKHVHRLTNSYSSFMQEHHVTGLFQVLHTLWASAQREGQIFWSQKCQIWERITTWDCW